MREMGRERKRKVREREGERGGGGGGQTDRQCKQYTRSLYPFDQRKNLVLNLDSIPYNPVGDTASVDTGLFFPRRSISIKLVPHIAHS